MNNSNQNSNYKSFLLMVGASAVSMYITMYLNTYAFDHVYFSWTRMYMTLIGVSAMAIIMFLFMRKMYQDRAKNIGIIVGSVAIFLVSLFLVRQQEPIEDVRWMKAMIPHHSIAILTSSRAEISDPEVKKLAEEIIKAQRKEIEKIRKSINMTHQYKVSGMSCMGCKNNVERVLNSVSAVEQASVNLKEGTAEVKMTSHISVAKLQEVLSTNLLRNLIKKAMESITAPCIVKGIRPTTSQATAPFVGWTWYNKLVLYPLLLNLPVPCTLKLCGMNLVIVPFAEWT